MKPYSKSFLLSSLQKDLILVKRNTLAGVLCNRDLCEHVNLFIFLSSEFSAQLAQSMQTYKIKLICQDETNCSDAEGNTTLAGDNFRLFIQTDNIYIMRTAPHDKFPWLVIESLFIIFCLVRNYHSRLRKKNGRRTCTSIRKQKTFFYASMAPRCGW